MEDLKNRLTLFARERYDMGQTRFEDFCGLSHGTISAIKSSGPSAMNILRISVACPDLNLNWLFRGVGDMVIGEDKPAAEENSNTPPTPPFVSAGYVNINIGNWGELVELLKSTKL